MDDTYSEIAKALAKMEFNAKLNNLQNLPNGMAMGSGRVGVEMPVGESDRLSAGMNLMGMYSPQEKSIRPEGFDMSYQTGENKFGVQVNRPKFGPKGMSVNYSRSF
jgi:hypothetical protein